MNAPYCSLAQFREYSGGGVVSGLNQNIGDVELNDMLVVASGMRTALRKYRRFPED